MNNAVGVMTGRDLEDTWFTVKHAAFWQVPLQLYCPAAHIRAQHPVLHLSGALQKMLLA